jgi:DNA-binding FadR family transcriptional regulator
MSQPGLRLYRGRVSDQIVEDLRSQILNGELADGVRLPAERDLAAYYEVSVPTVREAVRVLTAMKLLNTRNGSRAVVTANGDALLRISLESVAQFEKMGPSDLLSLLGVLHAYGAQLAIEHATVADIEQLRAAVARTSEATDPQAIPVALWEFFSVLVGISRNPMLVALCKALGDIQIGTVVGLSDDERGEWQDVPASLYAQRVAIVDAIARRDPAASDIVREYHERVGKHARIVPQAQRITRSAPGLLASLSGWGAERTQSEEEHQISE